MIDGKRVLLVVCLVLTPVFASTNSHMSFHIYIDNVSPYYTFFTGLSLIEDINQEFSCSAHWVDDVRLSDYKIEWDHGGVSTNTTTYSIIDGWSNYTTTFNSADEGDVISYRIHASDSRLNWNHTTYRSVTVSSIKPENTLLEQDNASPIIGDNVEITSYWVDNFEVDNVVLQTNETGDWHDNGSPVNIDYTEGWANFTINTTGMNTSPYHWRLNGTDQVGNSNTTPINYFTPQ